jgi:carbon storage regulator
MIVVPRKKNESIVIGGGITLTVIEIRGDRVRLGIVSPPDMPVHLEELWKAVHEGVSGSSGEPSWEQPGALDDLLD